MSPPASSPTDHAGIWTISTQSLAGEKTIVYAVEDKVNRQWSHLLRPFCQNDSEQLADIFVYFIVEGWLVEWIH